MNWEIVIGLETHAQLSTVSKMFSGASTAFGAAPNTQASAVDIALPGVLPVANKGAVERAIRFGLAVNGGDPGNINRRSIFARKNYFYPDLPKGYQISQFEAPIVKGGEIAIISPTRGEIKVRLTRAHLEEDAGKSMHGLIFKAMHGLGPDVTGIDLNRAGIPLLEIVSEPDMRSAEEAVAYAKVLHGLVRWIGICDGNMQEGSFRCDANVSVRRPGTPLGTRREIKNLNSFRFLQQAIEYEAKWQIEQLEGGKQIIQATVLFDPDTGETRMMRTKEEAHDYRYFPDPDLLPLEITPDLIESVREDMFHQVGKRPDEWQAELTTTYALSLADAIALTNNNSRTPLIYVDAVEAAMLPGENKRTSAASKLCANWMINEYLPRQAADRESFPSVTIVEGVTGETMGGLIRRIREGKISASIARALFNEFWEESKARNFSTHGGHPERIDEIKRIDKIIEERGLLQVSDSSALEKIVDEVLIANSKQVEDYRAGKEKAFNSLVGQVMKATQGKANPAQVNEILKRKLSR
jgi:aspartyl-tRNA(Asn)/glutamyl-tRNA(Gln) amidotransferase subunit B